MVRKAAARGVKATVRTRSAAEAVGRSPERVIRLTRPGHAQRASRVTRSRAQGLHRWSRDLLPSVASRPHDLAAGLGGAAPSLFDRKRARGGAAPPPAPGGSVW